MENREQGKGRRRQNGRSKLELAEKLPSSKQQKLGSYDKSPRKHLSCRANFISQLKIPIFQLLLLNGTNILDRGASAEASKCLYTHQVYNEAGPIGPNQLLSNDISTNQNEGTDPLPKKTLLKDELQRMSLGFSLYHIHPSCNQESSSQFKNFAGCDFRRVDLSRCRTDLSIDYGEAHKVYRRPLMVIGLPYRLSAL